MIGALACALGLHRWGGPEFGPFAVDELRTCTRCRAVRRHNRFTHDISVTPAGARADLAASIVDPSVRIREGATRTQIKPPPKWPSGHPVPPPPPPRARRPTDPVLTATERADRADWEQMETTAARIQACADALMDLPASAPSPSVVDRIPAAPHCQTGRADICRAGQRDGVVCPPDSCDIDDGGRPADPAVDGHAMTFDEFFDRLGAACGRPVDRPTPVYCVPTADGRAYTHHAERVPLADNLVLFAGADLPAVDLAIATDAQRWRCYERNLPQCAGHTRRFVDAMLRRDQGPADDATASTGAYRYTDWAPR